MQAMLADLSPLAAERTAYRAPVPAVLASPKAVTLVAGDATVARSEADHAALKSWFPHSYGSSPIVSFAAGKGAVAAAGNGAVADAHKPLRVAICFNGRQTPGGHNLVAGACCGGAAWGWSVIRARLAAVLPARPRAPHCAGRSPCCRRLLLPPPSSSCLQACLTTSRR